MPVDEVDASAEAEATVETDPQETAREDTQTDRTTLVARAQDRVTNLAANMSNRMEAVIERLQNIATRLESRMTKMSDSGVDTTAGAAALASAQLSLDAAVTEISDIDASVYAAVSSADARTGWTTLKAKFTSIKDFIKTAHSELRSSVSLVKEASLAAQAEQSAEAGVE
jgi:intracellular sulfur oxidation DsrE/DsrF family protein